MKKFLVMFRAPVAIMDGWMAKPESERKEAEDTMKGEWQAWMMEHAAAIKESPAGLGKASQVTSAGVADARNDLMMYSILEGESKDAVAALFVRHPHLGIPEATIEVMEIRPMSDAN